MVSVESRLILGIFFRARETELKPGAIKAITMADIIDLMADIIDLAKHDTYLTNARGTNGFMADLSPYPKPLHLFRLLLSSMINRNDDSHAGQIRPDFFHAIHDIEKQTPIVG